MFQFPTVTICNRNLWKSSLMMHPNYTTEHERNLSISIMKDLYSVPGAGSYYPDKYVHVLYTSRIRSYNSLFYNGSASGGLCNGLWCVNSSLHSTTRPQLLQKVISHLSLFALHGYYIYLVNTHLSFSIVFLILYVQIQLE